MKLKYIMCGIWAFISRRNISYDLMRGCFNSSHALKARGPETSSFITINNKIVMIFHRLAINGLEENGNQPFVTNDGKISCICNGEIYNYKNLKEKYPQFDLKSTSDCEIIPYLYDIYGCNVQHSLDGEFASIIVSKHDNCNPHNIYDLFAVRDKFGVRPLFYVINNDGIYLSSEMKGIYNFGKVRIFPPSHIMMLRIVDNWKDDDIKIYQYYNFDLPIQPCINIEDIIRDKFMSCVRKRLMTDRPIGCLLSGGLDSSIVSAVVANYLPKKTLRTFTIGFENGSDVYYAQKASEHIGTIHTFFKISIEEALSAIEDTIYAIESFDTTTVRASVFQYLLGKYIRNTTNIKVLLTGEGSDELMGGYLYFHLAPSPNAFHEENIRLLKDIHKYDGLRVDRAMAMNGLEVRIPFLDPEFTKFFLSIDPTLRIPRCRDETCPSNENNPPIEKYLFRKAFEQTNLLPQEVLWRRKEAFSDGVSTIKKSWFQILQEHIDTLVSNEEFEKEKIKYTHCPPTTKEMYYYRKIFEKHFGDNNSSVIPYFWMPKWTNSTDPSARTLKIYKNNSLI